jgi:hypothetical protein
MGGALFTWDHSLANTAEQTIHARAEEVVRGGGDVLFMSQRQLLALKEVDVPLVPAYEQDYLMEMVMSHNQAYLSQFQNDLRNQRFAMIVADPQYDHLYSLDRGFAAENNLWVMDVSRPLLCYYQSANPPGMDPGVTIYIPRSQPCN